MTSTIEVQKDPKDDIQQLGFTMRVLNCFRAENISSITQLLTFSEEELCKIPNFGRKSGREVVEVLEAQGLKLRDHNTPPPSRRLMQAEHHLEVATKAFEKASEEFRKAIAEFARVEHALYKWR